MPAAAVIPAPTAYTNVVAVKKLVVRIVSRADGSTGSVPLHTDALAGHPAGGGSGAARRARPSACGLGTLARPLAARSRSPTSRLGGSSAARRGSFGTWCPGPRSVFPPGAPASAVLARGRAGPIGLTGGAVRHRASPGLGRETVRQSSRCGALHRVSLRAGTLTLNKLECSSRGVQKTSERAWPAYRCMG